MRAWLLFGILSLVAPVMAGQSNADVVEPPDESPAKAPDKPEEIATVPVAIPKTESDEIQRTPLEIDEPDFKARLLKPAKSELGGDPLAELRKAKKKPKETKTSEFAVPAEEGVDEAALETPEEIEEKPEVSKALAEVIAREKGRKPKDLIPLYAEVVEAEPDNAEAHYRLGLQLYKGGEPQKALVALERAVQLNNKEAKYLCDFGLVAVRSGWTEKGLAACEGAARIRPNVARYQSAFGDVLLTSGQLAQARDAYMRACNLAPNNAEYVHSLGTVFLYGGEWKRAINIFDEAINLKSDASMFYCSRGLAYRNNKDVKQAIVDFNLALRADKKNAYAHYLLASTYSDPDDPTYTSSFQAMDHAQASVKLSEGKNAQYLMGLARAMRVSRNYDQAVDVARRASQLDPRYRGELAKFEELKSQSVKK